METKKNPLLDLEKRRGAFFNFSLMTSIALVLLAFEFRTDSGNENSITAKDLEKWDENLPEIPITIQEIPQPKILAPIIEIVPDDIPLDDIPEIIFQVDPSDLKDIQLADAPPVVEEADVIVDFSEIMPEPVGGMKAWNEYLSKNLKYPSQARRIGIEGTVFVSFVVDKTGKITEIQLVRGIGGGCDEEAQRVIEQAPVWKPGYQGGRPTKVRMRVPIRFKLQ